LQIAPLRPQWSLLLGVWHVPSWPGPPVQHPPGQVSPVQTHAPPLHVVRSGHDVPHVPQLAGSVCVLTQVPLQQFGLVESVHPSIVPVQQALWRMQTSPHGL
jgi:hypothetical protein